MSNSNGIGSRPVIAPSLKHPRMEEPRNSLRKESSSLVARDSNVSGVNALSAPVTPAKTVQSIDRSKVPSEILEAAEGMEAMFIDYMMKVMRDTVPKNSLDLESPASRIYRGMLDSEFAQKAAHHGGIGLSDQIIAYLESRRYNSIQGQHVPQGVPKKEKP